MNCQKVVINIASLNEIMSAVNKKFKEELVGVGVRRKKYGKIPFTSMCLNYLTRGGIPRGVLIEFSGAEGSGKSTSSLDLVGNAQRLFQQEWEDEIKTLEEMSKRNKTQEEQLRLLKLTGAKKVVYIDVENTLDEDWATTLGVDIENLLVIQTTEQSAEDIFQIILDMIPTNEIGLIILDSLGAMTSKQAFEKQMDEKTYGGISQPLTTFSKKVTGLCADTGTTLLAINQLRDNLSSAYGGTVTTGGRGWKHQCSLRLQFNKGRFVDNKNAELTNGAENVAGAYSEVIVVKNKVTKPDRRMAKFIIKFEEGIDKYADIIFLGEHFGLISKGGAWYQFINTETGEIFTDENGEVKLQGQGKVIEYLKARPELYEDLATRLIELCSE